MRVPRPGVMASAIARRPWWVVATAVLVAVLCALAASKLRLETDLVALLPSGTPEARDYGLFLEQFGGFEKVFVLIMQDPGTEADSRESPTVSAQGELLEAAEELTETLLASADVSAVRSGLESQDEEFFLRFVVRRAALLVPEEALVDVEQRWQPEALERTAARLRAQLSSPGGALAARLAVYDPLGFAADLPQMAGGGELPVDPWTGAFLAPSGDATLLVLTPAGGELDAEGGRRLKETLESAFEDLAARRPGLVARAIGGPLYAAEDEALIRADLEKTLFGSVAGCTLILLLAFRGPWIPSVAIAVLAAAFLATAAVLAGLFGSITAAGLGFAAVLVGLGMDYGIHGGTRFRQALLTGEDAPGALAACFRDAGPGIATSALTTAVAFATLGVAHFRPLRELGVVVAAGILAILIASATLGAALLVASPRAGRGGGFLWRALESAVRGTVAFATRRPRAVLSVALLLTLVALVGATRLHLDPDVGALRPTNHPVFETERLLVERFGLGIDTATVVISGADLEEALGRALAARRLVLPAIGEGGSVQSATDWLVASGAVQGRLEKFRDAGLAEAVPRLRAALAASNLSPRAFEPGLTALEALGRGEDPGAPGEMDWPASLGELLRTGPSGQVWAALRLRLPEGSWATGPSPQLLEDLERVAPGAAVASAPRLGLAMKRVAGQDLGRLALLGFALVALVVGISFRGDFRACLIAGVPVTLGTLWALGFWGITGRSLDLLSLSVVPILLGIGIDDGLHAVHGAIPGEKGKKRFAGRRLPESVAGAGLAMALTTLTTCVGFGSLTVSSIPGLVSGGLLVSIGVVACLAATLLVLPALGALGR